MLSLSWGPFALATHHLVLLGALVLATVVGWLSGRPRKINPDQALFGLFLLGLVVARAAFVAAYWQQYHGDLLQIIDIRDGGFIAWPGVLAVLLGGAVRGCKQNASRLPLGAGVVSGLLFWWLANLVLSTQQEARLPDLVLKNAAGESVQLSELEGKKLVINLWATWCPPCRREMPVLQAAQKDNADVVFLFVNQAQTPREVATFLASQNLHLNNVLFDASGSLAQQVGSAALPTTLFYNPDGRLLGSHLGELSSASLKRFLNALSDSAAMPSFQARSTP